MRRTIAGSRGARYLEASQKERRPCGQKRKRTCNAGSSPPRRMNGRNRAMTNGWPPTLRRASRNWTRARAFRPMKSGGPSASNEADNLAQGGPPPSGNSRPYRPRRQPACCLAGDPAHSAECRNAGRLSRNWRTLAGWLDPRPGRVRSALSGALPDQG